MDVMNAIPPEQMTPMQRADEIASILVRAILRAHAAVDSSATMASPTLGFSVRQRVNTDPSHPMKRS